MLSGVIQDSLNWTVEVFGPDCLQSEVGCVVTQGDFEQLRTRTHLAMLETNDVYAMAAGKCITLVQLNSWRRFRDAWADFAETATGFWGSDIDELEGYIRGLSQYRAAIEQSCKNDKSPTVGPAPLPAVPAALAKEFDQQKAAVNPEAPVKPGEEGLLESWFNKVDTTLRSKAAEYGKDAGASAKEELMGPLVAVGTMVVIGGLLWFVGKKKKPPQSP